MKTKTPWIILHPTVFKGSWFLVFVIRFATTLCVGMFMWYFRWLAQDTGHQREWRRDVHSLSPRTMNSVILAFLMVLVCHLYKLVEMVYVSYSENRLVFQRTQQLTSVDEVTRLLTMKTDEPAACTAVGGVGYPGVSLAETHQAFPRRSLIPHRSSSSPSNLDLPSSKQTPVPSMRLELMRCFMRISNALDKVWKPFQSLLGVFGIGSKWFNEVFAARESLELAIQTYEVYRMHCLIANDLVNGFAVTILFLSSISTFVIEVWTAEFRRKSMKTRLWLMLTDAFADFMFAIGIPLAIQTSLYQSFNPATMSFSAEQLSDRLWFANAIRVFQQFSLTSSWDIGSTIVFQIGLLYCLWKVQAIVKREDQIHPRRSQPPAHDTLVNSGFQLIVESSVRRAFAFFKNKLLEYLSMVHASIGVMALLAFVYARLIANKPIQGCELYGYEWFRSHSVCIVLEIDCAQRHIEGQNTSIQRILDELDTKWLFFLGFSNCPALEVPSGIRKIPTLYTFEVYNSTLSSWPSGAAFTEQSNPALTHIQLLRTTFPNEVLPEALRTHVLPSTTKSMLLIDTNLRTLPDQVVDAWWPVSELKLEHGQFTELPEVLSRMTSIKLLSIVNNSISSLPSRLFDELRLNRLRISGNSLTELPTSLENAALSLEQLCVLNAEYTFSSSIPSWLQGFLMKSYRNPVASCQNSLYGSTLCSNRVTRSLLGRDMPMNSIDWLLSVCFTDQQSINGWMGLQSIEHIEPRR